MKILLIAMIVGSILVGAVTLVTAAASYSVGKPHLVVVNLVLFAWSIYCVYWARDLMRET